MSVPDHRRILDVEKSTGNYHCDLVFQHLPTFEAGRVNEAESGPGGSGDTPDPEAATGNE